MSKVQNALLNPFYHGVMRYGGGFYAGKHEPLITEEIFDRCRKIMNGRARAKSRGFKPFMYRGLVRCGECGCTVTMEIQKGHRYLRCSKRKGPCGQKHLREEEFRTLVRRAIREVSIDLVLADEILRELRIMSDRDALLASDEVARLRQEIAEAESRRDLLWDDYKRVISVEQLRDRENGLNMERRSLEEKAEQMEKSAGGWFEPVAKFVNASFEASCVADRNEPGETWKFFKFVGSNPTLRNGQLQWAPRGAWKLLVNEEVADRDERALPDGCAETVAETRPNRIKRRGGDSNPRYTCAYTAFPMLLLQPLGHLSGEGCKSRKRGPCCLRFEGLEKTAWPPGNPSGHASRQTRSTSPTPSQP